MSSSPTAFQLPTSASQGFKDAGAYDAHRPSYPQDAVNDFLIQLGLSGRRGARIVEIASGTGKFTELLSRRPEGFDVVAVEPHKEMREQLVGRKLDRVKVLDGHAASLPVEKEWEGSVEGYIAAQSLHWFANEDAFAEAHRVLKPGGGFGAIWNIEDYNKPELWQATTKWEDKLNKWIRSIPSDGQPRFRDGVWRTALESHDHGQFSLPFGEKGFKWTVWLSEDALWSRINTLSQVSVLEGKAREAAMEVFQEALQTDDVEKDEGKIALHGVTYFVWSHKVEES
ncbi:putative methyltransferase [Podospora australis]|uniref:Methyltransferase n=1 Tax=Podospora australis TaxID=1536484 RepID=A0AAN6X792_9PEZI|nr:putative methyltransferase [Podospora australis]